MTEETSSSSVSVTILPTANIRVECFAVGLTSSVLQGFDEPHIIRTMHDDTVGIVGTITLFKNSTMIWMGWGKIQQNCTQAPQMSGVPSMGQLVVAMPRTKYKGAFSDEGGASTSQLVGGDSEDQILGAQMASRLSTTLGYPIFVSCHFNAADNLEWMAGLEKSAVTQRAAALAERKVRLLLQDYSKDTTQLK